MIHLDGQWRDLPLGHYCWVEISVLDEMLAMLVRDANLEWVIVDRSAAVIIRAIFWTE